MVKRCIKIDHAIQGQHIQKPNIVLDHNRYKGDVGGIDQILYTSIRPVSAHNSVKRYRKCFHGHRDIQLFTRELFIYLRKVKKNIAFVYFKESKGNEESLPSRGDFVKNNHFAWNLDLVANK